jgi:predicted MPP superfamily phosphohydrolase
MRPFRLPEGSGAYLSGRYDDGEASLFVSRGVGTSRLPVRFASRPELAIVDVLPTL